MRFGSAVGILAMLALAGCGDGSADNSEEQDRADAKAVAQVMAQQTPPPEQLALQPILYDDIVADDRMEGAGCSFYPEGAEDPTAVLGDGVGFLKFEGSVKFFAPDAGSAEGPFGTRAEYDSREYAFSIAIDEAAKEAGEGYWAAPAKIMLTDGYDRQVAAQSGRVGCGG